MESTKRIGLLLKATRPARLLGLVCLLGAACGEGMGPEEGEAIRSAARRRPRRVSEGDKRVSEGDKTILPDDLAKSTPFGANYPSVGLILGYDQYGRSHNKCTSVLIAPRVIATAGHCLDPSRTSLMPFVVVFPGSSKQYLILKPGVLWHFDKNTDIGVAALAEAVPTSVARPMPISTAEIDFGEQATLVGYGTSRTYRIYQMTTQETNRHWMYLTGSTGPRRGDSGGPVLDSVSRIIGIIARKFSSGLGGVATPMSVWGTWYMGAANHLNSNYSVPPQSRTFDQLNEEIPNLTALENIPAISNLVKMKSEGDFNGDGCDDTLVWNKTGVKIWNQYYDEVVVNFGCGKGLWSTHIPLGAARIHVEDIDGTTGDEAVFSLSTKKAITVLNPRTKSSHTWTNLPSSFQFRIGNVDGMPGAEIVLAAPSRVVILHWTGWREQTITSDIPYSYRINGLYDVDGKPGAEIVLLSGTVGGLRIVNPRRSLVSSVMISGSNFRIRGHGNLDDQPGQEIVISGTQGTGKIHVIDGDESTTIKKHTYTMQRSHFHIHSFSNTDGEDGDEIVVVSWDGAQIIDHRAGSIRTYSAPGGYRIDKLELLVDKDPESGMRIKMVRGNDTRWFTDGQAPPSCLGGEELCGSSCVDLGSNESHCGSCNHRCTSGATCVNGKCETPPPSCLGGKELCGSSCVDLGSNQSHCGSCNHSCTSGATCVNGKCETPPPPLPNKHAPIGHLDGVTNNTASGWACDKDGPTASIEIRLYLGGTWNSGVPASSIIANRTSEAAINNMCGGGKSHRFIYSLPSSWQAAVGKPIYVYAVDLTKGSSYSLLSEAPQTVKVANKHAPIGYFDAIANGVALGWACDQDGPSDSVEIRLYLGGTWNSGVPSLSIVANRRSEAAVNNICGGGRSHRFIYSLPSSWRAAIGKPIYAYAIDLTKGEALLSNAQVQ